MLLFKIIKAYSEEACMLLFKPHKGSFRKGVQVGFQDHKGAVSVAIGAKLQKIVQCGAFDIMRRKVLQIGINRPL